MACRDEAIDKRLIFRIDLHIERTDVTVPMLLGARAGDRGGDELVVQHPGERKIRRRNALRCGMGRDLLGDFDRFRTPFRFQNTLVATADAGIGARLFARLIFACQHAACER
ncbi:hypothetical protein D3C72_1036890 [compost metagenome]